MALIQPIQPNEGYTGRNNPHPAARGQAVITFLVIALVVLLLALMYAAWGIAPYVNIAAVIGLAVFAAYNLPVASAWDALFIGLVFWLGLRSFFLMNEPEESSYRRPASSGAGEAPRGVKRTVVYGGAEHPPGRVAPALHRRSPPTAGRPAVGGEGVQASPGR